MKAIVIDEASAGRPLLFCDVPDPVPGDNDLLVAVRAAGVNRADLRRAASHFAASEQRSFNIAGLELAGEVIAVGPSVRHFQPGDRIMAMAGGAYAEKTIVDARLAVAVPPSLDWIEAAATPIAFITAYDALTAAAGLQAGESVLVQGASSGAGIACVEIARWLGAGHVLGTAGSVDKLARLAELGCTTPVNYRTQDIVAAVHSVTDGKGVAVVIDIVGGEMAQRNIDCAAIQGRIVCLGRVAGSEATMNLDEFSRKRLRMIGITFRTRTFDERVAVIERFRREVVPALERHELRPVVDRTFPMAEAGAAQDYMRTNRHFGKIVLTP